MLLLKCLEMSRHEFFPFQVLCVAELEWKRKKSPAREPVCCNFFGLSRRWIFDSDDHIESLFWSKADVVVCPEVNLSMCSCISSCSTTVVTLDKPPKDVLSAELSCNTNLTTLSSPDNFKTKLNWLGAKQVQDYMSGPPSWRVAERSASSGLEFVRHFLRSDQLRI